MQAAPPIPYIGQIHPPQFEAVNPLRDTTVGTKLVKVFGTIVAAIVFGAIAWWIGHFFQWKWLSYAGAGFVGLIMLLMIKAALQGMRVECPCCKKEIGSDIETDLMVSDRKKQLACPFCREWLISDSGSVRAFREEDITDQKEFDCPVFENGIWPNECVSCGAAPTRSLEARSGKLNLGSLAVGRLSVSLGKVKNIPYCAAHKDGVSVKIVNDKLHLAFEDYRARRRYLHANHANTAALLAQLKSRQEPQDAKRG